MMQKLLFLFAARVLRLIQDLAQKGISVQLTCGLCVIFFVSIIQGFLWPPLLVWPCTQTLVSSH